MYYILENFKLKKMEDVLEWGRWMENGARQIGDSELDQDVRISTVFLGIDHGFEMKNKAINPIIFETMIFGESAEGFCIRYRTIAAAINGHEKILSAILNDEDLGDIEWD